MAMNTLVLDNLANKTQELPNSQRKHRPLRELHDNRGGLGSNAKRDYQNYRTFKDLLEKFNLSKSNYSSRTASSARQEKLSSFRNHRTLTDFDDSRSRIYKFPSTETSYMIHRVPPTYFGFQPHYHAPLISPIGAMPHFFMRNYL